MALYVSNSLSFKLRPGICFDQESAQSLFIETENVNSKNYVIGVVYKPPSSNSDLFLEEFDILLSRILREGKSVHILGDFNINLLSDDRISFQFMNVLRSNSFEPLIDKPTRSTPQTDTLIDNIFTNIDHTLFSSGIIYSDISDHLPVFTLLSEMKQQTKSQSKNETYLKRKYTPGTIVILSLVLSSESWENVFLEENAEKAFNIFMSKFNYYLNKNIPKVNRKLKQNCSIKP